MSRIVLDTNVYISAFVFGGKPKEILERVLSGKDEFFLSPTILEEISGVLSRPKFQFTELLIRQIVGELVVLEEIVTPKKQINAISEDPEDNRVLECAVECNADYVITGDKHLLGLGTYNDIKINNPSDFLSLS